MLDVTDERSALADRNAISRLWAADHTLWSDDTREISDRLGWLTVVPEMMAELDKLRSQCASLAAEVDHVLVMGMGGSSLFPEVIARSLPTEPDLPDLVVLDTTDPQAIDRAGAELLPERTLHIAASKSGTTLETRSHLEWAWERHPDPKRFAVITDPGSELGALARERNFAAIWENRPDIGGRYSALSYFGLVPALLSRPSSVDGLLGSASAMAERLRGPVPANPAADLAAVLAAGVRSGRDKVTLLLPDEIAAFGLWLEQLLAESTGKDGTGVIPIVGEPLAALDHYGDDRLFISLGEHEAATFATHYSGVSDLGGQVLLWEAATALCGVLLGIHPFDQPDVAAAKAATNEVLAGGGRDEPVVPLSELLDQIKPGDYLAIQAFVDPGSAVVDQIEAARVLLRDRYKVATTVGLGPRFLHSTGQLHKGGPNTGVFVQVVGTDDGEVDGESRFGKLIRAQAEGDLRTLHQRGRRAGRVRLNDLVELAT